MKFENVYIIFLFFLVILININSINLPYYWDDFNYVAPAIDYVFNNGPTIFLWEQGLGHPPFLFILIGLVFKLLGNSLIVAHSVILFFAFLAVLFTYLLGKELISRKTGIIASLLLAFTPIFVSYSSLLHLEMPLTALTIMAVYFAVKNKHWLSIIFGSLAVLTKEIGIVIVLGVFLAKIIKERKIKTLVYGIPILVFILLIILNKIYYGYFIYPVSTSLINIVPIKNLIFAITILKSLFFDQFRWILTSIIVLSLISKNLFKKPRKQIILASILSLFLLAMMFSLSFLGFDKYFQNINIYLLLLKKISVFISLAFFLFILNIKKFLSVYIKKDLYEIYIPALFIIWAHFLIIPFPPRYILPAYPIMFVIFGYSVNRLFKKYAYLFTILFIILSISLFTGERSTVGFTLEDNLEYRDFIKVRQSGASYIEENFPNTTVLTSYPLSDDLSLPYGGYVTKSINVSTYDPLPVVSRKNYAQALKGNLSQTPINVNEIDLYYYSPQEFANQKVNDAKNKLNLTLLKKFGLNNKSVEIYKVEGVKAS